MRARALAYLGAVWQLSGEYERAADALDRALELFREGPRPWGEAETLNPLQSAGLGNRRDRQVPLPPRPGATPGPQDMSAMDEADALDRIGATY